ncbi:MAG: peptidoglycan bridge formation glycyltransferase FemA/FemB family protein [Spirochaetia bacterium]|nr:peptidoglycan bridge formation glycyltransferase FemA/FemB family protein [Spirochaetia bacterium]
MKFIDITDNLEKKLLANDFLAKQDKSQFLQSLYWQNIVNSEGDKTKWYIVLNDKDEIILSSFLIEKKYYFFKYYYTPRGPVVSSFLLKEGDNLNKVISFWEEEIFKSLKKNMCFLRIEPMFNYNSSRYRIIKSRQIQTQKTLLLDLSLSEEELLKQMHQKTRYNIRLAKKKEVEIKEGTIDNINSFYELLRNTKDRNSFGIHPRDHYEKLLSDSSGKIKLYLAYYNKKIIAGGLFSFFGDQATYLHGASSNEYRNIMAPYLIQWEAIKEGKRNSCKYYDFWGISDSLWPGVTRFKKGFGGFVYNYPGTFDIIVNKNRYFLYSFLRKIRKKLS